MEGWDTEKNHVISSQMRPCTNHVDNDKLFKGPLLDSSKLPPTDASFSRTHHSNLISIRS